MQKTLLVLKNELVNTLTSPSFLFAIFGVPLIALVIYSLAARVQQDSQAASLVTEILSSPPQIEAEGYIDQSGLIRSLPEAVPPGTLIAYPDEATAREALDIGEIGAYYIVPPDYLETGEIIYSRPDFNPITASDQARLFEWVVNVNLLGGDVQLASLLNGPLELKEQSLSPEPQRDQNNMLTFFLPYAVTMLFYITILGSASLLLSSVTKEKENRVLELLMTSINPTQMLSGKIIGLGLVGLLQTVLWVGTGRYLLSAGQGVFNLSAAFQLPASFLAWGLVFFLLGYVAYASLMAGLGALVPNLREASQASFFVILPMIIPLFLVNILIEDPHGTVSVILSLFPLTSPVTMMSRLASGGVPAWQPYLAAALLLLTCAIIVRAVARMFRAQTLLSGQPFNLKSFYRALFLGS
jgi:ABC-2 type transport system permease protein